MAIYTIDKQPFHGIPDGLQTFERLPPQNVIPNKSDRPHPHDERQRLD
jgi:hypothetical protein